MTKIKMAFSSQIMFRPWNLKAKSNQSASTAQRVFEDPQKTKFIEICVVLKASALRLWSFLLVFSNWLRPWSLVVGWDVVFFAMFSISSLIFKSILIWRILIWNAAGAKSWILNHWWIEPGVVGRGQKNLYPWGRRLWLALNWFDFDE